MNDFTAGDVIEAACAISRRIPRDLALVGVDGMPKAGGDIETSSNRDKDAYALFSGA